MGSIPGLGRSPGEGNGNPLHYSCLENPMDGGAWRAAVHGVAKSRTRLSDFTVTFLVPQMVKNLPAMQETWVTGKTIALTRWTFVGKVMSVLFNMLSRFAITFLLRSKHLLISWLQSPSAVILEPKKIKSATVSTFPPSTCHEVIGLDAMILAF